MPSIVFCSPFMASTAVISERANVFAQQPPLLAHAFLLFWGTNAETQSQMQEGNMVHCWAWAKSLKAVCFLKLGDILRSKEFSNWLTLPKIYRYFSFQPQNFRCLEQGTHLCWDLHQLYNPQVVSLHLFHTVPAFPKVRTAPSKGWPGWSVSS